MDQDHYISLSLRLTFDGNITEVDVSTSLPSPSFWGRRFDLQNLVFATDSGVRLRLPQNDTIFSPSFWDRRIDLSELVQNLSSASGILVPRMTG
jgi:hypothetical protein